MALKVGGLCEGYGGTFLALQQHLDVEHAWYAEVDEAAKKVLAHHYPDVPNLGDITAVDWAEVARAGRADGGLAVLTAGWPCQPFSLSGPRRGSTDARHLWPTGVRPAIAALMPPLFVGENVPGLLTIENGQVFAQVLADLDDLGYTVSWTTVGACKVGACHHRHRVFLAATLVDVRAPLSDPIAHRSGEGWAPAQFVLFGDAQAVKWPTAGFAAGGAAWELPSDPCGADDVVFPTPRTSDTNGAGQHRNGGLDLRTAGAMLPTPLAHDALRTRTSPGDLARKSPALEPGDLARKSPALEAVVSLLPTPRAIDAHSGAQTLVDGRTAGDRGPRLGDIGQLLHMLPTPTATSYGNNQSDSPGASVRPSLDGIAKFLPTPRASHGEKGGPNQRGSSGDVMLPAAVQPLRFGKYAAAVHRHELAFGPSAPDPTEPGRSGKPRLSAAFPEWMQALPPGYLTGVVERKDALRLAGNGVHWPAAAFALGMLPTFRAAVDALADKAVAA